MKFALREGLSARLVASCLPILCAGLAVSGCAGDIPEASERQPRPVRTVPAQPLEGSVERVFSGVVQAPTRSKLSFRVPGRLVARPVDIGSELTRGRLIAELDATDFRLRLGQAEADLRRSKAAAREAEGEYGRIRALYADGHATRRQLDRASAALEQAAGRLEQSEQRLEIARRELSYTRLEAAGRGRISELFVEVGENLQAGQAVVAWIDDAPLEVEWTVPASWINRFQPETDVEITVFDLNEGTPITGTVVEIGATPRESGVTYPVVARITDRVNGLRPGMSADVRVRIADDRPSAQSVALPPHAVIGDPGGYFVFVVEDSASDSGDSELRSVERRRVTVGQLTADGLEVLSGLRDGEIVVSAGAGFLDDGQQVRLLRGDPLAELPSTSPRDQGIGGQP